MDAKVKGSGHGSSRATPHHTRSIIEFSVQEFFSTHSMTMVNYSFDLIVRGYQQSADTIQSHIPTAYILYGSKLQLTYTGVLSIG